MRIARRTFMGAFGAAIASFSLPSMKDADEAGKAQVSLERNGWRLQVSEGGEIVSFTDGKMELINRRLGGNRPRVVVGNMRLYDCEQPSASRQEGSRLIFRYDFAAPDDFSVNYELELAEVPSTLVTLRQKVGIEAKRKITESVKLILPRNLQLPYEYRKVFLPMKNGIGRRKPILGYESENEYVYAMAGSYERMGKPQMLAIPMVDEYADATGLRLTHCTDPYFSSYFYLPQGEKVGNFNCVYLEEVGVEREERVVYTAVHRGGEKGAMEVFYATALGEVKAGPDWQHEVAIVDYDYFSKNGEGWFRDIDALTKLVAPEDRPKVFLALHGWYGYVGQYAFDWRKGVFFKEWTAFPNALDPHFQSLPDAPDSGTGSFGTGLIWPKASVRAMRPVPMSLADMHRRIRYAKDKGFQVGVYYADGTNSSDGLKDLFDPSKVLHWGGWEGPDTTGKTYGQNPLHPEVRQFYMKYIQALLDEYGKEVDGFIWDETFGVSPNELGPSAAPGYASRGMMTLVRDVAATVASFSPQLAFFASDDIGAFSEYEQNVPYCLVVHGTYQDSWCTPGGWSYGLFPNYRNTLWSCNWAPVTRLEYSRYAVEMFDAPVPISNGALGDDIGIGDMTASQQRKVVDLFEARKRRRMEITWVEEEARHFEYQGKEVTHKWNL